MAGRAPRVDRLDKNLLINGNFDFWQRGTTFSSSSYGADRWKSSSGVSASGYTRQSGGFDARSLYSARITGTSGLVAIFQHVESNRSRQIQSDFITIKIKTKTTSGTPTLELRIDTPTITDNYSSVNTLFVQNIGTLSTSWQEFEYTFPVTANMRSLGFRVLIGNTSVSGSTTFDFSQISLVEGNNAVDFCLAGKDYAEEFALCQRYYQTFSHIRAFGVNTTTIYANITYPVWMRSNPTISLSGPLNMQNGIDNLTQSSSNVGSIDPTVRSTIIQCGNFTGVTQFRPYNLAIPGNNSNIIIADAEIN